VSELEPRVEAREFPADVERLRAQIAAEHDELDALYQPAIEALIDALAEEVEGVIHMHRLIADRTDLELKAETRWAAIWELSGRCLAICRVVLHDLRGGFGSEAAGNARALWEASILLAAVAFHEEEQLLRRWLAGEYVRPFEARAAVERKEALAREGMEAEGVGPTAELGEKIYDLLSQPAHHRRGGFPESIQVDAREFAYGPHPDAVVRADYLNYVGHLIEIALINVITSLADLIGLHYARDALDRMQERLECVREQFPLPD
jgi:hypothetical protein